MKAFSAKTLLSVVATTIIVSGLAYAANINSVATQTVNSGDTMGPGWYQRVNDFVNAGASGGASAPVTSMPIYSCPSTTTCTDGQNVDGAWASYGCVGQLSQQASCVQIWHNGGGYSCTNACTKIQ